MTALPEMPCQEFVERVTDYLEDAMDPRDAERLETHLDACEHCSLYLDQMRATLRIAGELRAADVPAHGREELRRAFRRWTAGSAPHDSA